MVIMGIEIKEQNEAEADFFQNAPFNFCDRWCERCDYGDRCELFQNTLASRVEHIARGEDPDNPAIVFADMEKTFALVVETIKKDLQKRGLDPKRVRVAVIEAGNAGRQLGIGAPSLWLVGRKFVAEVNDLLTKIFSEQDDELNEAIENIGERRIEEINWYLVLFNAKLYQALVEKRFWEKEKSRLARSIREREMNISANLSYRSLMSCQRVLFYISRHCRGYMGWAENLSISAKLLGEKIESQFPELSKTKVIFHGQYQNKESGRF